MFHVIRNREWRGVLYYLVSVKSKPMLRLQTDSNRIETRATFQSILSFAK